MLGFRGREKIFKEKCQIRYSNNSSITMELYKNKINYINDKYDKNRKISFLHGVRTVFRNGKMKRNKKLIYIRL